MPELETGGRGGGNRNKWGANYQEALGEGEWRGFCSFNEFRIINSFSSIKISTNLRCRSETQNQNRLYNWK
jgi:hypothetical protein